METPEDVKTKSFRDKIRQQCRIVEPCGSQALKHSDQSKEWTPEEKLKLVSLVLAGKSISIVAVSAGISNGLLCQWVQKYKTMGYNGLVNKKRGGSPVENVL